MGGRGGCAGCSACASTCARALPPARARSCRAAQRCACPCPQQRACGPRHTHPPQPRGARAATARNGGFQGRGGVARAAARGGHTHTERTHAACAAQWGVAQRSGPGGGRRARATLRCAARAVACAAANRETLAPGGSGSSARAAALLGGAHRPSTPCDGATHAARTAAATRAWPSTTRSAEGQEDRVHAFMPARMCCVASTQALNVNSFNPAAQLRSCRIVRPPPSVAPPPPSRGRLRRTPPLRAARVSQRAAARTHARARIVAPPVAPRPLFFTLLLLRACACACGRHSQRAACVCLPRGRARACMRLSRLLGAPARLPLPPLRCHVHVRAAAAAMSAPPPPPAPELPSGGAAADALRRLSCVGQCGRCAPTHTRTRSDTLSLMHPSSSPLSRLPATRRLYRTRSCPPAWRRCRCGRWSRRAPPSRAPSPRAISQPQSPFSTPSPRWRRRRGTTRTCTCATTATCASCSPRTPWEGAQRLRRCVSARACVNASSEGCSLALARAARAR
jgi:hypothetical protein